jgi:hypothetical protein
LKRFWKAECKSEIVTAIHMRERLGKIAKTNIMAKISSGGNCLVWIKAGLRRADKLGEQVEGSAGQKKTRQRTCGNELRLSSGKVEP